MKRLHAIFVSVKKSVVKAAVKSKREIRFVADGLIARRCSKRFGKAIEDNKLYFPTFKECGRIVRFTLAKIVKELRRASR